MEWFAYSLVVVAAVAGVVACIASVSGQPDAAVTPGAEPKIPSGYRDWRLIPVAHEALQKRTLKQIETQI